MESTLTKIEVMHNALCAKLFKSCESDDLGGGRQWIVVGCHGAVASIEFLVIMVTPLSLSLPARAEGAAAYNHGQR